LQRNERQSAKKQKKGVELDSDPPGRNIDRTIFTIFTDLNTFHAQQQNKTQIS
jgi:hypothetical protein